MNAYGCSSPPRSSFRIARASAAPRKVQSIHSILDAPSDTVLTPFYIGSTLLPALTSSSRLIDPVNVATNISLLTVFTPPAGCNGGLAQQQAASSATAIASTPACYPRSWEYVQVTRSSYYSPGVCPTNFAWVSAGIALDREGGSITQAMCCPSGLYSYTSDAADVGMYCYSGPEMGSYTNETGKYALPISVAWAESDLTRFQPPSAPLTALQRDGWALAPSTTAPNATITPAPTSSPPAQTASATSTTGGNTQGSSNQVDNNQVDNNQGGNDQGGGFSTGAAAGIGVGATVVAFAAIGVLWWYMRRRRHNRSHPTGHGEVTDTTETAKDRPEKDGNERFEIGTKEKPSEAAGRSIAELDSGWQAPEVDGTDAHPAK